MSKYPISYNGKVLFTLQCTFTSIVLFNPHSGLARKVLFFLFVGEETFPVQTALLRSRPCFRHLGWHTSTPSIMHPKRNSVSSRSPWIQTGTCSSSRTAHLSSWHHHLPTQVGRNLQDSSLSFSPSLPTCHLSVKFPPSSIPYLSVPLLQTTLPVLAQTPITSPGLMHQPGCYFELLSCQSHSYLIPALVPLPSRPHIPMLTAWFL